MPARSRTSEPTLGLRANWRQFALLVLVNGFVGAMVGLERTVLPLLGTREFGVASASAALSFIVSFGLAKAAANLGAGWLAERRGRRWTLITGWLVALPVPLMVLWAPSWAWVVAANGLLGVGQGLAWSTTVMMKIDLVGSRQRGLAIGLNEFAGYVALGLAALASAWLASRLGLRAGVGYLGLPIALIGLLFSGFAVRDTTGHARLEERETPPSETGPSPSLGGLLRSSLGSDRTLFSLSQAGFVNNLNDGVAWGMLPLIFAGTGLSLIQTGALAALYPIVWGLSQVVIGGLSDRYGRKPFIVGGMVLQGFALIELTAWQGIMPWSIGLTALGIGTAMVYPTLLAGVADGYRPSVRAGAVGVYRLWRDLGYVGGALAAGIVADRFGFFAALQAVGALTIGSGIISASLYRDVRPTRFLDRHDCRTELPGFHIKEVSP